MSSREEGDEVKRKEKKRTLESESESESDSSSSSSSDSSSSSSSSSSDSSSKKRQRKKEKKEKKRRKKEKKKEKKRLKKEKKKRTKELKELKKQEKKRTLSQDRPTHPQTPQTKITTTIENQKPASQPQTSTQTKDAESSSAATPKRVMGPITQRVCPYITPIILAIPIIPITSIIPNNFIQQHDDNESVIREVWDDDTGRMRLVRGSGEIIERIVTREQHLAINKQATNWVTSYPRK